MGGPIALDMRDGSLTTAMEVGIIFEADPSVGGVQIMEHRW